MSSNEKQIQQHNNINSIHLENLTSVKNEENKFKLNTYPLSNQNKASDVPYDWQKFIMDRKEYLAQTNPASTSNYQNQINAIYSTSEGNNTQIKGVYAPVYKDLNRNHVYLNTNNAKLNNNSIISDSLSSNDSLINGNLNASQPQLNQAFILEEKNKEIRDLKEILNILYTENTTNKLLLIKLTEENTKKLIEINQFKINQNNNNANDVNLTFLESKVKELEKESESFKKDLNFKSECLENSNQKIEELENEIKKNSILEHTEITEDFIKNSLPYIDLNFKFENLDEERKNLKSYTSELQTLYGEIIEDYRDLKPKAAEAQKLEKTLDALRQKFSDATSAKDVLEAKLHEAEQGTESAKAKNSALKVEKESLVETINRLNKEIELVKEEANSNKLGKLKTVPSYINLNNFNSNNNNNKNTASGLNDSKIAVNDLPELFKLELEEKQKAIQILQYSLEERDRIIEQFKCEQNKMISRNKSSHHDLINTIEDLKFKIINSENEINEKNNFISLHNNEFNIKKLETENLNLENIQLKDHILLIPLLKNEIENFKAHFKKQISQADGIKEQINAKESRIVMLEKTISALKNELDEKETQLTLATEEYNITKLYEKKRDIIHSTLLGIRDLKEKISKDKHNLTIAFNTSPHNLFTDYSRDLTDNNINNNNFNFNNETMSNNNNRNFAHNFNSLLKSTDNDANFSLSNNANISNINAYSNLNLTRNQPIQEATEGLESYRKVTEDDILFYQNILKSFDLNLLTEFDFLLNSKNWKLISFWLSALNDHKKSVNSGRSNSKSKSNSNSFKNFKLKLLFKATKDGFSHLDFKEKCAGKPNTLVIAVTNFDKFIGGFTPLPWDNTEEHVYVKDDSEKSFIFSLNKKQKLRLINAEHAICLSPDSGPIFGGGSDFEIVDNCNVNYNNFFRVGHSYEYDDIAEKFFGAKKYLIRDYEVYEVLEY